MPSLSVRDAVVGEIDAFVDIEVRLDAPVASTVTVNYATASDSATSADYSPVNGSLTFAPGEISKTVRIGIDNDTIVEQLQSFRLNLSNPVNATLAKASTMISIVDNDTVAGTPGLFVRDVIVDEKDGTAAFVVTLGPATRGTASNSTVTVNYATADLTATAGNDYMAKSGVLTFTPGQTVKVILIDLLDDAAAEGFERFALNLSNPQNAVLTAPQARATISAGDGTNSSQPRISVLDYIVGEGDSYIDVAVSLNAPSQNTVSVGYATASDSATSADYRPVNGSLVFAPGETSKVVRIEIDNDTIVEALQSFRLNLSSPVNAVLERGGALISIVDNDTAVGTPGLYVRDVSVDERAGTAAFVVTLGSSTRGAVSNSTVTVNYATADLTAKAGSDYVARSGTLVFAPGETVKTVLVDLLDDALAESGERFALALSGAVNASIVDGLAVAEIAANDVTGLPQPRLSVQDAVVSEADSYVDMVISLSAPGQGVVSVNYATASDSATSADYSPVNGSLSFAPGETSKVVRIEIDNDTIVELLQSFRLNLSGAVGATITASSALILIVDDDTSAPLSFGRSDDIYDIGTTASTAIVENPGGGFDIVRASASYILPANVEALVLQPGALNATGNATNNVFRGNAANNTFDGQGGTDTVVFTGPSANYSVSGTLAQRTVSSTADGNDTLLSVERLHFTDVILASDTSPGGNVYAVHALFNAAFNRAPTTAELSLWTSQLDTLDSAQSLAQAMINHYAPGVPDAALVTHLWGTIVGTAITPGNLATYTGMIANGTFTQASLLEFVSNHALNTSEIVGIVGTTQMLEPALFPSLG